MDLITWTSDLSIGINSIDEQHKVIINMINSLNVALDDGSSHQVIPEIFDSLAVYIKTHMDYEESLFQQYVYVESKSHIEEHTKLKHQVFELQERMKGGDFMVGIELISFLKDWLNHHILEIDMAYSEFLISKGVK